MYQVLDSSRGEIRLLEIHGGDFYEVVKCTLSVGSLEDNPSFEALSYVWGDEKDRANITLQDESTSVTVNLKLALQHLRHSDRPRVVWADALCINQEDDVERASQVALMGDIYRGAAGVVAWLGEASPLSDAAIDAFRGLGADIEKHWDPAGHDSVDPKFLTRDAIRGIIDIMERPWWRRVWTVQESILCRRFSFHCGTRELPSDYICATAERYYQHASNCCFAYWSKEPSYILDPMNQYMDFPLMLKQSREAVENLELQGMISLNRVRQCKDPRDKIYGMLGLDKREYKGDIVPDYSKSIPEVFEEAAIHLLRRPPGGFRLFSLILPNKDIESSESLASFLPSWVPDWRALGSIDDYRQLDNRAACLGLCRAGGMPMRAPGYRGDGRLICNAAIIATISETGAPCSPDLPLEGVDDVYSDWRRLARVDADPDRSYPFVKKARAALHHIESMAVSDAFWLTLCSSALHMNDPGRRKRIGLSAANMHNPVDRVRDDPTDADTMEGHWLLHDAWWHWFQNQNQNQNQALEAYGLEPRLKHGKTHGELARYDKSIFASTNLRRLFLTGGDVGLMGLAPIHAKPGDAVAIIEGAFVPVILRRAEGIGRLWHKVRGSGAQ